MSLKLTTKNNINNDKKILTTFFIIIISFSVKATIINGQNKDYAGKTLNFYYYTDPITLNKKLLFSLKIDEQGNFNNNIKITKTIYTFCDFGIYRGMLFIEPNEKISLLLPPLQKKTFAEKKNPYFNPIKFWFATREGDKLNDIISKFDLKLNHLINENFYQLYFSKPQETFDSIHIKINNEFDVTTSPTFVLHKTLTLQILKTDVYKKSTKNTANIISKIEETYWTHPAFINLFEKTFEKKLSEENGKINGFPVKQAIYKEDISLLQNFIQKKYGLTGNITRLALLKMLHDAFYSNNFPKEKIVKIISSPYFLSNKNEFIKQSAQSTIKKLQFLYPGTLAPVICLYDINGQKICSDKTTSNSNKFKYLIFVDTEMIICKEQLKYLKNINERFNKYLEIIIIIKNTDIIEAKQFLYKQKIPGIHLIDKTEDIIDRYNIKSFPYCILLNNEHKVIFQQAKSPLDGFEQQFGPFLQKKLFERQRQKHINK